MSEEQPKTFLEKDKTNTESQEKLNTATTPRTTMEIAKTARISTAKNDIQSIQSDKELKQK